MINSHSTEPSSASRSVSGRRVARLAGIGARIDGTFFAACAMGNAIWTVPIAESFLAWLHDGAWLPPYPWVLDRLVPVAAAVVGLTVVAEAVIAVLLWMPRSQEWGLWLAAAWTLVLIPAIAYPYWLANLLLGSVIAALAFTMHRGREQTPAGSVVNSLSIGR